MTPPELLDSRIIFLSQPVDTVAATEVIAALLLLDARASDQPIDLYLNSPGGNVADGLAIIDAMLCIGAPVRTICIGQAASMAAVILAAGAPGSRMATPNAEIMVHQMSVGFGGQYADFQAQAGRLAELQQRLVAMLSTWCGRDREAMAADLSKEQWFTAEAALEYGLIDVVLPTQRGGLPR